MNNATDWVNNFEQYTTCYVVSLDSITYSKNFKSIKIECYHFS
jgi:hypothetical protein